MYVTAETLRSTAAGFAARGFTTKAVALEELAELAGAHPIWVETSRLR